MQKKICLKDLKYHKSKYQVQFLLLNKKKNKKKRNNYQMKKKNYLKDLKVLNSKVQFSLLKKVKIRKQVEKKICLKDLLHKFNSKLQMLLFLKKKKMKKKNQNNHQMKMICLKILKVFKLNCTLQQLLKKNKRIMIK